MEPKSIIVTEPLAAPVEQILVFSTPEFASADRLEMKILSNKSLVITNLSSAVSTGT
jgi:hypothetical protein